ncbi:sugar ABC transporter permease [Thermatribacter velox]|uniref:Sugar ABC transporter permease n=1 Tax=Thermatribacter velox TaxID=3039681 RepID=A0ABZ2YCY0_9BACT
MKLGSRRKWIGYAFVLPAFFFMVVFILYPLIESLILSFYDWTGISAKTFVGFENFRYLLKDRVFWLALKNNLIFTVLATAGTVILGFFLAVAIERRVRGWWFYKVVYFLPVMVSMTVVGLLWGRLLDPTLGPVNFILKKLGVASPPFWLGDPKTSLLSIIGVSIWQYAGFPMIILLAAMENVPLEVHDAATIDGVSEWQRIWYIIFPLIKPVFLMITVLQIIFSFKVFDIVWAMTQGGPGDSSIVLGVYLYKAAFRYTRFGYGAAIAVAMFLIIFPLSLLYIRLTRLEEAVEE